MGGPTIAARRLEIMAAARAAGDDLLRFDPARLRFSLGTSLSDVRIPVHVAPDAAGIIRAAAVELAMLLVTQHRSFVPVDELDRVFLAEGFASLPAAAATLGPSGGGNDLRTAAQVGPAVHPALSGGVLCAWMGPGGRGRSLTALFIESLREAFQEMEACRGREPTPIIAMIALVSELLEADRPVLEVVPSPPLDRYLRAATFAGLWIAARTGLARAWRGAGRPAPDPVLWRLEAVLSPGVLLGGRVVGLGGATVYGCELQAVPRAEDLVARLALGTDPDAVVGDLTRAVAADEELARRAELAVAAAHVRRLLHSGTAAAEAQGYGQAVAWVRDLYAAPSALSSALADDGARRELVRRLGHGARGTGEAKAAFERAGAALETWDRRSPTASLGLSREEARAEYATAAGALLADTALERLLAPARRAVVARVGDEAEGGAEAEWEEGRLYRISARGGPILKQTSERPLGHLFADVKDFTRRTALLGRAPMAEFLRTEFYRPILVAAKSYFAGMPHLADRGGIAINNLVGDAISFSGDVEALVMLAGEIRRLLAAYEARLARQVSEEAKARQLAAVEARLQAEAELVARCIAQARASGATGTQIHRLEQEQQRLADERALALARARDEGLSAGVFVSFGPAPVTVLIDDEVFGQNRVAIAEKINESARGTARAASARARADAALQAARAAGHASAEHAWSVFVEPPLAIEIPPELEQRAIAAARDGDLAAALRQLSGPVRAALERAVDGDEAAGDIYNGGAALSEEALNAYLDAIQGTREVRRLTLGPAEIPAKLRERWFFGTAPLELVVAFDAAGSQRQLFRRAGVATFKGLGGVTVWEMASAGGALELARQLVEKLRRAG